MASHVFFVSSEGTQWTDTFKNWCSWTLTDWLRELNTAFIPFIPWQVTDYAIKEQDLKGGIRQRSLQIYLASGEHGSLKTFLAAFLLIPLNHLPLIVETWVWDETLDQILEGEVASKTIFCFSLIVTESLHFVLTVFGALLFSVATRPTLGTLCRSDGIKVTEVKIQRLHGINVKPFVLISP